MAHGSSSQTSTNVPRGGRGSVPTGTAGALRRRGARPSASSGSSQSKVSQNVMNFYTDDSPGIKIPPFLVVVLSLCFIGFVTMLHVIGKIRGV